jgi:hypothetical protein
VNSKFTGDTSKYDAASGGSGSVVVVVNHVMSPELLELVCRAFASARACVCSYVVVCVFVARVCDSVYACVVVYAYVCFTVAHVCDSLCVFVPRGSLATSRVRCSLCARPPS